jgi:sigma54-dependent transcription regulator
MEQDNLNLLKNIKRIEVSATLYDKIAQRIELKRANTVPFYKVGIAASLLFALIISQVLFISKLEKMNSSNLTQPNELIEMNNNNLYYE